VSGTEPVDVVLRPAQDADADAVADVMLAARDACVAAGTMPPSVHPASDLPRHVRQGLLGRLEVWVAHEPDGPVVAVMALDDTWLDDLYVAPRRAGRGIGSALLDLAKALRPGGFGLWVFEMNGPARRFYERHGLVPVERTDGSGNEERAPDVRYAWRPDGAVSVPRATVLLT
jgi:GNAT superfamily N-acetyltransferase